MWLLENLKLHMWLAFVACIIFILPSSGLEHCEFWGWDEALWEIDNSNVSPVPFTCSSTALGEELVSSIAIINADQCRNFPTTLFAFTLTSNPCPWNCRRHLSTVFCFLFLLKYSWFTMLCQSLLYSKVTQLYIYIYVYILFQILFPYRWLQNIESSSPESLF